jgi:enoyl-CoA hydratase
MEEHDMETLKYEVEGHFLADEESIGVITLNRPDALNGINPQMVKEFTELLDKIEKDDKVRAVIIRSASDKVFSSGADLKAAASLASDPKAGRKFLEDGQALFRRIETFPKPIVAELNALVIGGGLEMAMAADLRVAAKDAKCWVTEVVNVGLIPGWGGTQRLPRLVGMGRAKEIVLTGRQIPADEAFEIGLVNKVAPSDELHSEALFMAQQMADAAPVAVRLAKKTLNMSYDVTMEEGNKEELEALLETTQTEDFGIGVSAIFQKSKPKFKGK